MFMHVWIKYLSCLSKKYITLFVGVQTPNCIRQTVFDAVALDYQSVTVLVDATAAATPDIHIGMYYQFHEILVGTLFG
jgi:nicotinamidase-related amidase